jgi:hypothetical protein
MVYLWICTEADKDAAFLSPAYERPNRGRSKAMKIKSFLVTFFQKSNCFLTKSSKGRTA